ncbi:MAG TPA: homoserine O-acetyltransferase [Xanthobacteraceae bacterium]|nr:homoserine O-acetyltransferase [Xanthobacteraceae bacterium]
MRRHIAGLAALFCICAALASPARSADLIVEKRTFELPSYTTVAGETIKAVKVGWEAAGTLNADKSNAILITHYFSGTSHAFGKYAPEDKAAGYWDAIIGPGKAIDTDKYYVLSSDTLVNLNTKQPNVVTTGPASINPDTGKPYGMSFPVVSIRDFVRVEKALVDSLGIRKLHAVVGASMGGLQAYEWGQSYPDGVDRIVAVVAPPATDSYLIGWLDLWAQPIRLDPKWNSGDYYGKEPPTEGLKAALKLVTLQANGWEWARASFGTAPAEAGKDPAKSLDNKFKIEAYLEQAAAARAAVADANHFLYLCRANQLAAADPAKIKVPALVLYAPNDLIYYEPIMRETIEKIAAAGGSVESGTLIGPNGHLDAFTAIGPKAAEITAFLAK